MGNSESIPARVLMPTWRKFMPIAARGLPYEAQDVFASVDDVDLIALEPGSGFRWKQMWQRRLLWRDVTRKLAYLNPGLKRVRLQKDYDLLVQICTSWWDLFYINAIDGWTDRCRTKICILDELWVGWLPLFKYWLPALRRFDHLFVAYEGTAKPLSEAVGRPCHFLPSAVDVLRFSPYPNPPEHGPQVGWRASLAAGNVAQQRNILHLRYRPGCGRHEASGSGATPVYARKPG
jgi:hypothetical protein